VNCQDHYCMPPLERFDLDRSLTAKFISAKINARNYGIPGYYFRENL